MKYPYIALYTGDWKKDAELSLCSPATRGIWIDLICSMHDGRISQVTGTAEQLSRLCRCNAAEISAAIKELAETNTASVQQRDGIYTVICRRLKDRENLSKLRSASGSKGGSKTQANREQNPEYESEDEDESLGRVREFARGEGISEHDADWFFWKGKGNGWTNGGKPILDWKATLRSWNRAKYLPSQRTISSGNGAFERKMSAFEIQQRLDAVNGRINKLYPDKEKHSVELAALKETKAKLKQQLVS